MSCPYNQLSTTAKHRLLSFGSAITFTGVKLMAAVYLLLSISATSGSSKSRHSGSNSSGSSGYGGKASTQASSIPPVPQPAIKRTKDKDRKKKKLKTSTDGNAAATTSGTVAGSPGATTTGQSTGTTLSNNGGDQGSNFAEGDHPTAAVSGITGSAAGSASAPTSSGNKELGTSGAGATGNDDLNGSGELNEITGNESAQGGSRDADQVAADQISNEEKGKYSRTKNYP